MHLPPSIERNGFVRATAPLKVGFVEKEEVLFFMVVAATMKQMEALAILCFLVPTFLIYLWRRFTRHHAPGEMGFRASLKLGGVREWPYIGRLIKGIGDSMAEHWKDTGSLPPPTHTDTYEP